MFQDLKTIVDLLVTGFSEVNKLASANQKEKAILDMLRVYFMFKDVVEDGRELLGDAGSDPIKLLSGMPTEARKGKLKSWQIILSRQGKRLYTLLGMIFEQDHLEIINPALEKRISDVIGDKLERVDSLHGIGASLFFANMFGSNYEGNEQANLVCAMFRANNDDLLDVKKCEIELDTMEDALEEYRMLCNVYVSPDEILSLSKQARKETKFP